MSRISPGSRNSSHLLGISSPLLPPHFTTLSHSISCRIQGTRTVYHHCCSPDHSRSFTRSLNMPQTFADYDSQCLSSRQKHISFLPTSKTARQAHHQHNSSYTSPLQYEVEANHHRKDSSNSAATSAATSRSSTTTSTHSNYTHDTMGGLTVREANMKAREITPTSDVALWAHQMHIKQGQSHWWCQGCFPKEVADPMPIPKAHTQTGRRVRITNEPTHCYDI